MDRGWPNSGQLPQQHDVAGMDLSNDDSLLFGLDFAADLGDDMQGEGSAQAWAQYTNGSPQVAPMHGQTPRQYLAAQVTTGPLALDAFFQSNGGWRPPEPCYYCKKMRLQCFMLQTSDVNPNPVTSCSSCVALFRQCSLAERAKRHHSEFETRAPVIGQLHGVSEEGHLDPPFPWQQQQQQQQQYEHDQHQILQVAGEEIAHAARSSSHDHLEPRVQPGQRPGSFTGSASGKRLSARMVKRTRALRDWFASHQGHPYPSDEEKASLAAESGLSRVQVANWFTNARRRQRQSARAAAKPDFFASGSPMPQRSPNDASPMERWQNSPPEDEAVDPSALQNALSDLREQGNPPGATTGAGHHRARRRSSHLTFSSGGGSQASSYDPTQTTWFEAPRSHSASSVQSHASLPGDVFGLASPHEGYSSEDTGQLSDRLRRATIVTAPSSSANTPSTPHRPLLQCTFCCRSFKKKSDWARHERTIHVPDLDSWICSAALLQDTNPSSQLVWRLGRADPECVFCGAPSPTAEHLRSHEFEACGERPVAERTFARKDHLWQHLKKFHGCKRWEGWSLDLNRLQSGNDEVGSRCGFCGLVMASWKERAQHVAAHFRSGLTMAQWTGNAGILSHRVVRE